MITFMIMIEIMMMMMMIMIEIMMMVIVMMIMIIIVMLLIHKSLIITLHYVIIAYRLLGECSLPRRSC